MKTKCSGAVGLIFLVLLTVCKALDINECQNRFTCRNGDCGSTASAQADRCNSIFNCLDGSDESNCDVCPDGFYCDSGDECLSSVNDRCNGVSDCDDGSDEANCRITSVPLSVPAIIGITVGLFILIVIVPTILCVVICCCVLYSMAKTTPSNNSSSTNKPSFDNNRNIDLRPEPSYALTEIPKQEIEANSVSPYNYPASGPSTAYSVDGLPLDGFEAYSPPPQAYDPPLDRNTRFGH